MANVKALSPDRQRKAALKKQREIAKWEKEKARPRRNTYLIYMLFMICLVFITDMIDLPADVDGDRKGSVCRLRRSVAVKDRHDRSAFFPLHRGLAVL